MVVRVAERAALSGAAAVWVATDHAEIEAACRAHGVAVMQTRADHPSGTDRLAEVAARLQLAPDAIVVNLQGDEPLMDPMLVHAVADCLASDPDAAIATACHPISSAAEFFNPNVVKVVCDARGRARAFSRAPIPYARDAFAASNSVLPTGLPCFRHIGLYAYRARFLDAYARLPPCDWERFEALEQLRALWHGYAINVLVTPNAPPAGVDTAEDLERARAAWSVLEPQVTSTTSTTVTTATAGRV